MASVDFHKCKNASDVAAMMRHNDDAEVFCAEQRGK